LHRIFRAIGAVGTGRSSAVTGVFVKNVSSLTT